MVFKSTLVIRDESEITALCIFQVQLIDRHTREFAVISLISNKTVYFYTVFPHQLLQSETGVTHFVLDPLTHRSFLTRSPNADSAEPRPLATHVILVFYTQSTRIAFQIEVKALESHGLL